MAHLIEAPTRIPVPGGKTIDEYVGRVNTQTSKLSVAHMVAPPGWTEPAQVPAFDEITLVLRGMVRVEVFGTSGPPEVLEVRAQQAVLTKAGERVRYSTDLAGAEYVAICLPAFSPETAHRDGDA